MERDKPNVKQERINVNEYRKGLVCLVPKQGMTGDIDYWPITSHEKTLCDCQVLEIFSAYDKALERIEVLEKTLKFYSASDNYKFIYPGGPCPAIIIQDNGELAREALKGGE